MSDFNPHLPDFGVFKPKSARRRRLATPLNGRSRLFVPLIRALGLGRYAEIFQFQQGHVHNFIDFVVQLGDRSGIAIEGTPVGQVKDIKNPAAFQQRPFDGIMGLARRCLRDRPRLCTVSERTVFQLSARSRACAGKSLHDHPQKGRYACVHYKLARQVNVFFNLFL